MLTVLIYFRMVREVTYGSGKELRTGGLWMHQILRKRSWKRAPKMFVPFVGRRQPWMPYTKAQRRI